MYKNTECTDHKTPLKFILMLNKGNATEMVLILTKLKKKPITI